MMKQMNKTEKSIENEKQVCTENVAGKDYEVVNKIKLDCKYGQEMNQDTYWPKKPRFFNKPRFFLDKEAEHWMNKCWIPNNYLQLVQQQKFNNLQQKMSRKQKKQ